VHEQYEVTIQVCFRTRQPGSSGLSGPSSSQPHEKMLNEMIEAGYLGNEPGRLCFCPADPEVLRPKREEHNLGSVGLICDAGPD
jgi:hypothetical protein